jgi:hypothetical protein
LNLRPLDEIAAFPPLPFSLDERGFLGLLRRNLTDRTSVYRSVLESRVIVCGQ